MVPTEPTNTAFAPQFGMSDVDLKRFGIT